MLFFTLCWSTYAAHKLPGGGDGPTPFTQLDGFQNSVRIVPTNNGLRDFVFWENRNTVVYRNLYGQVWGVGLNRFESYFFSKRSAPLLDIADPFERFITASADENIYMLDAQGNPPQWYDLYQQNEGQPAFWNVDTLYTVSLTRINRKRQSFQVFDYQLNRGAEAKCPPVDLVSNNPVFLASGHAYPYIYFYMVHSTDLGQELYVSKFNVNTCQPEPDLIWGTTFSSEIQEVHRFPAIDSVAVKLNDPKRNLFWSGPSGSLFYNIANVSPVVLNFSTNPTIATWDGNSGLTLHFLNYATQASLMAGYPFTSVRSQDLKMSTDGSRLIFSPQLENGTRLLMEIEIGSPSKVAPPN
jgi:hypothetical protein